MVKMSKLPVDGVIETDVAALLRQFMANSHPPQSSPRWDKNSNGTIKSNTKNAIVALEELGVEVRRDTFSDVIYVDNEAPNNMLAEDYVGALSDNALTTVRKMILDFYRFDPGAENLWFAVAALAEQNRFNTVTDWLETLHWDGVSRLDSWLPAVTGADNTGLNCAAGRLIIQGMVARARYPATKFDVCVVLEGEQGCGKSSLVRYLATGPGEKFFTDAPGLVGMDNKERAELISGKWLVELAELSGLAKSEAEGVKAFLTQPSDRYRAAYARVAVDRQRTCIFVGTTNARAYLSDATGNRRFLPVRCGTIDLAKINEIRDQVFAEADRRLDTAIAAARLNGVAITAGKPLPAMFAGVHLTLPQYLRSEAAEATEERRTTDVLEEAVEAIIEREGDKAPCLPDGRAFISSAKLVGALRQHFNGNFNPSGLGSWMERLGWTPVITGSKEMRTRGYAKLQACTNEVSAISMSGQSEQGEH